MKALYIFLITVFFPVALSMGQAEHLSEPGEPLLVPNNNEQVISRLPSESGSLLQDINSPSLRVGPGDGEDTPIPTETPVKESAIPIALLAGVYALILGLRNRRRIMKAN